MVESSLNSFDSRLSFLTACSQHSVGCYTPAPNRGIKRGNVLAVGNCCYVARVTSLFVSCSVPQGASAPTGEERGGGIS